MNRITFILGLLILCSPSFAQVNIDSLLGVWNDESVNDEKRIGAIRDVAWDGYLNSKPDSAMYYAEELLEFSKERNNARGINIALVIMATYHKGFGNMDEALKLHEQNLEIQMLANNVEGQYSVLVNIGSVRTMMGEMSKAVEALDRAKKLAISQQDTMALYSVNLNLGYMYFNNNEKERALDYFNRSLELAKSIDYQIGISKSLVNIGTYYVVVKEDYRKGIHLFKRAGTINKEINDIMGLALVRGNIGECYLKMGMVDSARILFNENLEFYEEMGETPSTISTLTNLAEIYEMENNTQKAEQYFKRMHEIALRMDLPREISASALRLSKFYEDHQQAKKALMYYKTHKAYQDTVRVLQNEKELIRQEYRLKYEKKAAADSVRAAEAAKVKDAQLAAERAENTRQHQQNIFLFVGLGLAILFGLIIFNRFRLTRKQNVIIEEQKDQVDIAYGELEEKSQEILDSITYAKRIQHAILPSEKMWDKHLPNSIVLHKPKDIVAGDFYWMEPFAEASEPENEHKKGILFAAADCTGHGVPGAMVSVICNNALNRSVREFGLHKPAEILAKTREIVITEFKKSEEEVKDGMDIALCALKPLETNSEERQKYALSFAGAHNPLWIFRKDKEELEEIKGDKQPIGKFVAASTFEHHETVLNEGDTIYMFSDGFADQFGGPKGKKFKVANFKKFLLSIRELSMPEQKKRINETFESWRGDYEQLDDVCVIGVKI